MDETIPYPAHSRQEIENLWRARLEQARQRYDSAKAQYMLLLGLRRGSAFGEDQVLAAARQSESAALTEYTRILRIFTELTLYGRLPGDIDGGRPAAGGDGGRPAAFNGRDGE